MNLVVTSMTTTCGSWLRIGRDLELLLVGPQSRIAEQLQEVVWVTSSIEEFTWAKYFGP